MRGGASDVDSISFSSASRSRSLKPSMKPFGLACVRHVTSVDAELIRACQVDAAGRLATIVADYHLPPAAACHQPVQLQATQMQESKPSARAPGIRGRSHRIVK